MTEYVVLRDLGRPTTHEPFDAPRPEAGPSAVEVPSEPRIEAEALTKDEVRSLSRDPEVRAIARGMPTTLVYPFDVADAEAATTAWGVTAVGAEVSARTGAGITVAVLDTGIDSTHLAFTPWPRRNRSR